MLGDVQTKCPFCQLTVESVIKRLLNYLCPAGTIHSKMCGCKWGLLKVWEGKYKSEHGRAQVEVGG
jgi:hypothetical protein